MKKIALIIAVLMIFAVFAGCTNNQKNDEGEDVTTDNTQETADNTDGAEEPTEEPEETKDDNLIKYAFEFTDVNGKVHKLSDYEGKPVYLEVWGSWCSVCISGLEDMNEFAGEEHDYVVLSVVFPGHSGEMNEEDFIAWYKDLGYDNLVVMMDNDLQIIRDFGISGFPTNIFFDAEGNLAGGQVGQMLPDYIDKVMTGLVEE